MERSQVLDAMSQLKLYGMKAAYDEIITTAVKRQHEPQQIVVKTVERAERTERTERSDRNERSEKPRRERADRGGDRKRKDDDLILEPAPEKVKGFGNDIPAFLKR